MFNPAKSVKCCYFLFSFLLLKAGMVLAQTDLRQNMILESTFEDANYLSGWYNNQHCCAYSVQQTTEKIKAGSYALRLEVKSTDPTTSGSIRSEIALTSDPLNQDRWYGFSMYLKDWTDDDAGEHVFQWAPDNSNASAAIALLTNGGRFTLQTNNTGTTSNNVYADLGPVLSNQWIDFVIHIRWATDTTGLLQLWMNGSQLINRTSVKTATYTAFCKLGITKFGWGTQTSAVTQRILYFDEVRVGNASATYNDAAPFMPRRDYFQGL